MSVNTRPGRIDHWIPSAGKWAIGRFMARDIYLTTETARGRGGIKRAQSAPMAPKSQKAVNGRREIRPGRGVRGNLSQPHSGPATEIAKETEAPGRAGADPPG